ncbi:Gfo/Idh/MocA family protein [Pseudoroseomonas globiformis]|uniref:Gfo/Idh/MocA family protein n=1 Tax=Teichococcus globiformis TaxID=2307229 RepID=A0ABV7G400_9PROT
MIRPRIGFLGVGWIGRHRMEAVAQTGLAEIAAIADANPAMLEEAARIAPGARRVKGLEALLELPLDGLVIATPSALHAAQSIAGLRRGLAVFCQKPLGRDAAEVRAVIDAARAADRLLDVDLSYRFTEGMQRIRALVREGALGRVHAVDLVFHNAYGPDKAWFYDAAQSGGGCVMDLGVHLVDLALWTLDFPAVDSVSGTLFAGGERLRAGDGRVEDYATASIDLCNGAALRLACSWRLQAGQDAVISAAFYGTEGGAALRNIDGSFYDFSAERYRGTSRETLASAPDAWGGRAAADWARRLAAGGRFDAEIERVADVVGVLDRIYGR